MSRAEKAGELVLKAIDCNKRNELREAVRHLDEAIDCINYAMNYENYGSTGQHIMKQKLKQYTKYVGKLRAKLPPEEDVQEEADVHSQQVPQTTVTVHKVAEEKLITTALEEPQHEVVYPQLVPTALDEPDSGQLGAAGRLHATQDDTANTSQDDHQRELLNRIKSPTLRPAHQPDAASTTADGLFRMLPGEADYKNLGTAINFAKKATQADTENSLAEALDLYNKAIEFFYLSTNGELNTELGRQHVRPQVDYCESRAEVISRVLQSDRSGYLSTDDDGVDRDSTSDLGDRVGDAATLQRRPVDVQGEIVGLDVVRSVLLDAATSSTGSFRSILLVGATGTGKTSVVDNLFRNTSRHYIYKDAAVLNSIDGSLINVFEDARQVKPCVIFLDKIDELFPHGRQQPERSRNGDSRMLSKQLAEQLKDFDDRNKEIIFISATDCPWFISPEVRDRFDTVIYTPLPGAAERLSIAKLNTANLLHSLSEEDFITIAERTHGFTGADIDSVIRSAMVSTIKELQKATHFKEVRFTDDRDTKAWTPCSPEDPAATKMLWSDVVQVHPPEITMKHVMESLDGRCSSVPASEVYRLMNWVLQTGKAPPEQAELIRHRPEEPVDLPPGPSEVAATLATIGIGVSQPPYHPRPHSQQYSIQETPQHQVQETQQGLVAERPPVQEQEYGQSTRVETSKVQCSSSPMGGISEVELVSGVTAAGLVASSLDPPTHEASYVSTTADMSTQTEIIDESTSFSYYLDYPSMGSMGSMGPPMSMDAFCQTDCTDDQPEGLLIIPAALPIAATSPTGTVYKTPVLAETSTDPKSSQTYPKLYHQSTRSSSAPLQRFQPRRDESDVYETVTEQHVATPGVQQAPVGYVRTQAQSPHSDHLSTEPSSTSIQELQLGIDDHEVYETFTEQVTSGAAHAPAGYVGAWEQSPQSDKAVAGKVKQEQPPVDITLYSIDRQPLSITTEPIHKDIPRSPTSIHKDIHKSPTEPIHKSPTEPIHTSPTEPIHKDIPKSPTETMHKSPIKHIHKSSTEPIHKSPVKPIHKSATEPIKKSPTEPIHKDIHRPSTEPTHKDITLKDRTAAPPSVTTKPIHNVSTIGEQATAASASAPLSKHPQPIKQEPVFTAQSTKADSKPGSLAEPERPQTDKSGDKIAALAAVGVASGVLLQSEKYTPQKDISDNDGNNVTAQTAQESQKKEIPIEQNSKDPPAVVIPLVVSEVPQEEDRQPVVPKQGEEVKIPPQVETLKSEPDEIAPVAKVEQDKSKPEEVPALPQMEKDRSTSVETKTEEVEAVPEVDKESKVEEKTPLPSVEKDKPKPEETVAVPKVEGEKSKPKEATAAPHFEDKAKPEGPTPVPKVEQDKAKPGGGIAESPRVELVEYKPVQEPDPVNVGPSMTSTPIKVTRTGAHPQTPAAPAEEPPAVRDLDVSAVSDNNDKDDAETRSVQQYEEEGVEEGVKGIPTIITTPATPDTPEPVVRYDDPGTERKPITPPKDDASEQKPESANLKEKNVTAKEESKAQTPISHAVVPESVINSKPHPTAPNVTVEDLQQEEPEPQDLHDEEYFISSLTSIKEEEEEEEDATPADVPSAMSSAPRGSTPVEAPPPTGSKPEVSQVPPTVNAAQSPEEQVEPISPPPQAAGSAQPSKEEVKGTNASEKVPESEKLTGKEKVPESENVPESEKATGKVKVPESEKSPEPVIILSEVTGSEKDPEVPRSDEASVPPTSPPVQRPTGAVPTVLTLAMEEQFMKEQLRKMAEAADEEPPASVDVPDGVSVSKDPVSVSKDGVSVSKDEVQVSKESTKKDGQPPSSEPPGRSLPDVQTTWL